MGQSKRPMTTQKNINNNYYLKKKRSKKDQKEEKENFGRSPQLIDMNHTRKKNSSLFVSSKSH
jgi:hypothetical protein